MVKMFVRHLVSDYVTWRQAYDHFDEERTRMGVQGAAVYRSVDDPNDITVTHDFDTIEVARAVAEAPRLKELMAVAGVAHPPVVWFTEKV